MATVPVEWFAENWGPFDASLVGPADPGPGGHPLLLVDGVQITPDDQLGRRMIAHLVRDEHFAVPSDDFREVWVFKHRCDTAAFGAAGAVGIIMGFTHDWDGPMPAGQQSFAEPCDEDRG